MTETLRIAMVGACPLPDDRGTPIRIFRMAEALALLGCEVHVVTYHLGRITREAERTLPFRIHRIPNVPTYKKYSPGPTLQKLLAVDPLLFLTLKKVVSRRRFDIVHAHHYEGLIVSLLLREYHSLPVIYDAHTLLESELHYYLDKLPRQVVNRLGLLVDRKLPARADHVITVTPDIRDKLIAHAGIPPGRISMVMNGVELEHFNRASCPGNDRKMKKIAYAGNLGRFQGIPHLLKVFARIAGLRRNVELQLITNSSFKPYMALARKLGIASRIQIMPSTYEKLPEYLKEADVVLNPRVDCDGIPQKLLNYMAAGKPVVSFRGSAKIIEHRRTGYVVENGDYDEFAKSVLFLLDNPEIAESMGARAREIISEKFTWQSSARDTIHIYQRVMGLDSCQLRAGETPGVEKRRNDPENNPVYSGAIESGQIARIQGYSGKGGLRQPKAENFVPGRVGTIP